MDTHLETPKLPNIVDEKIQQDIGIIIEQLNTLMESGSESVDIDIHVILVFLKGLRHDNETAGKIYKLADDIETIIGD